MAGDGWPGDAWLPAQGSGFGSHVPAKLGQSLNLADHVGESEAYRRNRLDEEFALRRRGFWAYGVALLLLAVFGVIGLTTGITQGWFVVAPAAGLLVFRAYVDYRNAAFRGAPELSRFGWALVVIGAMIALSLFLVGLAEPWNRAVADLAATYGGSGAG